MKLYERKGRTYTGNAPIQHTHSLSDIIKKYKAISMILAAVLAVSVLINIYLVFARSEPQSAQEAPEIIKVTLPATTTEKVMEKAAESAAEATEATEAAQPRYYDVPLDKSLQDHIRELSAYYNIDMAMILAVIEVESNYQSDVISETNDYGLMQINECNHQRLAEQYGLTDMLDARQNLDAGIIILNDCINNSPNMHGALTAYNRGLGGAQKLWEQGIYETEYSRKVLDAFEKIRGNK